MGQTSYSEKVRYPEFIFFIFFFRYPEFIFFFVFKMTLFEIIVGASLIVLVSGSRINGVKRMNAPKLDSLEDGVLGKPTEKPLPDTNSDHQTKGVNAQPEPPPPPEHLQINRMGPQMIIKEFMGDITKRTGWLKATVEKNERELKGEITAAKTELETKINAVKSDVINIHTLGLKKIGKVLNDKITAVKTELETKINAVKSDVIDTHTLGLKKIGEALNGKITAVKTELETKINAIKSDVINIHTKGLKISEITAAKTE